jgi:hypothetical protein
MPFATFPQQQTTKTMKKIKSQTLLKIYMAFCLVMGVVFAYYFGDSPSRRFLWQREISDRWMITGITYSFFLFLGGFVQAILKRIR